MAGGGQDHILVLRQSGADPNGAPVIAAADLPGASVQEVGSESELKAALNNSVTDVVVLDCDWPLADLKKLIYELKNTDSQPAVIVLSSNPDALTINELYRHGCHRFVVKDRRSMDEVGVSVRHLLRLRQLEEENIRIRTRLTEANMHLDERNRRLDEFSATLAHDIRGPLGSVSMKLEYLLDHYNKHFDDRCTQLLTRALGSCKRLTEVVQAMYEFAKLGSKAARMDRVALGRLVDEVISDLHFNPALDIEIKVGDLPEVWGSAELLRRVFANLISNAVKYNDKPRICIQIEANGSIRRGLGEFCRVLVRDNGPGISADEREAIFSMFSRGEGAGGLADGIGIGLAVVRRIAELHFGEVRVESEPGEGASIAIYLPLDNVAIETL